MSRKRTAKRSSKRSTKGAKASKRRSTKGAGKTSRKVSAATRKKISRALNRYWKKKTLEERRIWGAKVSATLRAYWKEHASPLEKAWGRKLVKEEKKERRKIKTAGLSILDRGIAFMESLQENVVADSYIDSAIHADGSVDVELRISVPRGEDGRSMLLDLADRIIVPVDWWIAVGWIFSPSADMTDEEREAYEKFHKLLQVHTHYQQWDRKASNIVGALKIYDSLEDNRRRKPEQFYVRIHWSREGIKP